MKTIGHRLKHRRVIMGFNQKVVADVAGVTSAAVSKWESNGGESMSAIVAMRLARLLNVNPFWLIFSEGEPTEKLQVSEFPEQVRGMAERINRLPPHLRELMGQLLTELRP